MSKKKYIIYQITNLLNNMIYIGKHSTTTPYDMKRYWGSSDWLKSSIKIHGKINFKRETLFVFETEDEAYQKEAEIVDKVFVDREDTYNFRTGGEGGWEHLDTTKEKLSLLNSGENHPNYGKHLSKEIKGKISKSNKKYYTTTKGEKRKEKTRKLHRNKIVSEETKKKQKNSHLGKQQSQKTIQKRIEKTKLSSSTIKQRRKDIQNLVGIYNYNYKSELAEKWNVSKRCVKWFVEKYASDLDTGFDLIKKQRLLDIENISKTLGYKTKLAHKWGIGVATAGWFIEKYASDLIERKI